MEYNISNEETLDGNKLIAEFDGWSIEKGMESEGNPFYVKGLDICLTSKMQYNSSWDWLMPMVEKINHMPHRMGFFINNQFCGAHGLLHGGMSVSKTIVKIETGNNPLIQSVYKAVVEFIKWHNTKNT